VIGKLIKFSQRVARRLVSPLCVRKYARAEELVGRGVDTIREVFPSEKVIIGSPSQDPFIACSELYNDGAFTRRQVFIAELRNAVVAVDSGMVCTRSFRVLADSGKEHRIHAYPELGRWKPLKLVKVFGTVTTVNYCHAGNFWHWFVDCLPKLLTLERGCPDETITVVMPDSLFEWQRATLQSVVGPKFQLRYFPPKTWVRAERLLWPSLAAEIGCALLPGNYLQELRRRVFAAFPESDPSGPGRRLYISRRKARHRRVTNEDALAPVLKKHHVELYEPDGLGFAEQLRTFRSAALIVGPHGAGLGGGIFSDKLQLVVFYATRRPPNYFHTQAVALGHKHAFVCSDKDNEDVDFAVDPEALDSLLSRLAANAG
jgi:hypothetical protein